MGGWLLSGSRGPGSETWLPRAPPQGQQTGPSPARASRSPRAFPHRHPSSTAHRAGAASTRPHAHGSPFCSRRGNPPRVPEASIGAGAGGGHPPRSASCSSRRGTSPTHTKVPVHGRPLPASGRRAEGPQGQLPPGEPSLPLASSQGPGRGWREGAVQEVAERLRMVNPPLPPPPRGSSRRRGIPVLRRLLNRL